jgi:predicted secreted Zn-dependent protease
MKHSIGLILLFAAGLLVASCASLAQARPPTYQTTEPEVMRYETSLQDNVGVAINVWQKTYAVPGATEAEIARNLDALRVGRVNGEYSASTKWDLKWSMRYADEPDGCRIGAASIEIVDLVTLPSLKDAADVDAATLDTWQRYVASLTAHELQHVQNGIDAAEDLQASFLALGTLDSCGAVGVAANDLGEEHKAMIRDADARLDAETKHGALTGATFP